MFYRLNIDTPTFPIKGKGFSTSREAAAGAPRTVAEPLEVIISGHKHSGHGECLPYKHYGETIESVTQQINEIRHMIETGITREQLLTLMPAGAARNAVDAALWDLECKQSQKSIWEKTNTTPPKSIQTVYTLSVDTPENMVQQLREFGSTIKNIKLKLSGNIDEDIARIKAVHAASPTSSIVVDANEGMKTAEDYLRFSQEAAQNGVTMIEQPFPADKDDMLLEFPRDKRQIPICADESFHGIGDIDRLSQKYDILNIKLDKTGGLTAALDIMDKAKESGLGIMVGTMLASSLSMAPAYVLAAKGAQYVDLDSPMLLAKDRHNGLHYEGDSLFPPSETLWGGAGMEHKRDQKIFR